MSLHGVCTIALTPFTDEGELDEESIESLSGFYVDAGVHGITILGIMGEAHKLSDAERRTVTQRYVSAVRGRVPVVVQDEPVNTGVVMPAPFIARLVNEIAGCRYVKLEEAPTTIKISSLLQGIEAEVGVFGGLGGMYFYEELARGASGIMTGFAYPDVLVDTYRLFVEGERRKAQEHFFRYLPLIRFEAQLGVGGVGIRKEILRLRGVIASSHVRFPAPTLDEETLRELEDLVEVLGLAD